MKTTINLRLEEDTLAALDNYAKELERPRTFLIEKAITAYFDELDELIADQRIAEITGGSKNLIPLEEVQKKTGINV
ncbi:MAG: ribbon-helix-helix protein, CopG family [Bacteroidota bacterium]|nr:ribbon-helix-helix domain-containing protein [Bacteroidota bacterium]